jgi:hypothetical protein
MHLLVTLRVQTQEYLLLAHFDSIPEEVSLELGGALETGLW